MKKVIAWMLCLLCLTACGNAGKSAEPAPTTVPETSQTESVPEATAEPEEPKPEEAPEAQTVSTTTVSIAYGDLSFSLEVPEGWAYEEADPKTGIVSGICFRPEGSEGSVLFGFHDGMFGVCGTGLEQKTVTRLDGSVLSVGYYDGSEDWSFVSFRSMDETLAARNEGLTGEEAKEALAIILNAKMAVPDKNEKA